jgi:hypothetical protein
LVIDIYLFVDFFVSVVAYSIKYEKPCMRKFLDGDGMEPIEAGDKRMLNSGE